MAPSRRSARSSHRHPWPVPFVRVGFAGGPSPSTQLYPRCHCDCAGAASKEAEFRCYWEANVVSARNYAMFLVSEKTDWMP
ncbi:hypothetical protein Nmel_008198 [Mimus melanotis]